jgi:DNA-binding NtrC family response regulator
MTTPGLRVLVADDEDTFRRILIRELKEMGFEAQGAACGNEALNILKKEDVELVLLDVRMPGMNGLEVLREVKQNHPLTEVVMLTGHGTIDDAITAIRNGACDYLTKPCKLQELEAVLLKAGEKRQLQCRNLLLNQELSRRDGSGRFLGKSPKFQEIVRLIGKVAQSDSTVLLQGESGVGKELAARAVHRQSGRRDHPFIVVDCTSLQEDLLQNELFGHEKGAFTGAVGQKHGLFEVADTGTIFFDEIGEMSLSLQAKLLRVMETGTFRRVGGLKDIQVDARVIVATNRDLKQRCAAGLFRDDLYYRLNVFAITIPPLRERVEDIELLASHFLSNRMMPGRRTLRISPEALPLLKRYQWPGNIRELRNVIERAMILAEGESVEPQHLPGNLQSKTAAHFDFPKGEPPTLEQAEKLYIGRLLRENGGNRARVAKILDISERNLYRKIKEYGL